MSLVRWLCFLLLVGAAVAVRADEPRRAATIGEIALFEAAMRNTTQETERWAYTETTSVTVNKGRQRGDTIVMFDPSKPYAEQYSPVKINGKEPTEKQRKEYRKRGEKRGEKVARESETARGNPQIAAAPTLKVNNSHVTLDSAHAAVAAEDAEHITFMIPLHAEEKLDIPLEKFELLVRVGKERQLVENVRLKLLDSFRVKLVAKLKSGEATVDFTVIDPKFAPVVTRMSGNFDISVLFFAANGVLTNVRSDFRRVKPYDERFEVKLGPLKTLDF